MQSVINTQGHDMPLLLWADCDVQPLKTYNSLAFRCSRCAIPTRRVWFILAAADRFTQIDQWPHHAMGDLLRVGHESSPQGNIRQVEAARWWYVTSGK